MWILVGVLVLALVQGYSIEVRRNALRAGTFTRYELFSWFGRRVYLYYQVRSEPFSFCAPRAHCYLLSGWMVEVLGEDTSVFRMLHRLGQRWDYVEGGYYRVADCSIRGAWVLGVVDERNIPSA